jgi:hypothetical protein
MLVIAQVSCKQEMEHTVVRDIAREVSAISAQFEALHLPTILSE